MNLKGLIIVEPYGTFINNRQKTLIVKSRKFSIYGINLLLIENKLGLGIIVLEPPEKISISTFKKLAPEHLITDADRIKWWPTYKTLYAYQISTYHRFRRPILLDYPTGPQITVLSQNIKFNDINIGVSGYYYPQMYPAHTRDILNYYQQYLTSVEINSTFYHAPVKSTIDKLNKYDLSYSIKVPQQITHYRKLVGIKQLWANFYYALTPIHHKIKCFLFQFSKNFHYNDNTFGALKKLSRILHDGHRYAFEFRHESWFNDDIYGLFAKHGWAVVILNVHGSWSNLPNGYNPPLRDYQLTADFIYIRLHGSKSQYIGSYHDKDYKEIYDFIRGHNVNAHIYFNNTDHGSDAFDDAIKMGHKFNPVNLAIGID